MTTIATDDAGQVIYPDSDGKPMADNDQQRHLIETLDVGFADHFAGRDDVYTSADLLWYPVEGDPRVNRAPDNLVVFGRPPGQRRSWKQWEEGDIGPQVVFEILSQSNTAAEMIQKRRWYERYGVDELIVFDPETGTLDVYVRGGDLLLPQPDAATWQSDRLGLRFEPVEDGLDASGSPLWWLDVIGADGERWHRAKDLAAVARAEAARADALSAQLRALGIDPQAPPAS